MIFGCEGILGSAFYTKLSATSSTYRVFNFNHKMADITDQTHVNQLLEYIRPTAVINCAAVNDEDICQDAKAGAFSVNSRGPKNIAEACKKYGAKMVHFSSASVFNGHHCLPYSESHDAVPVNILGQSKISGEEAIKESCEDHLIIRPGWVFSFQSPSCIPFWINQAERSETISVLDDTHGSPTYVIDIVDATIDLLSHDAKGVFHFANSDAASRQSFAEAVLSLSKLKTKIVAVKPESQTFFKAPVPRYTVLSTKKYSQLVNKETRSWVDALKHCLFNMQRYKP